MDISRALKKAQKFVDRGVHEKALAWYKRITDQHPEVHPAWCNQGFLLEEAGRLEEARHCYERAILAKPHHVLTIDLLARVNVKIGRHRDAHFWLQKRIGFRGFKNDEEESVVGQLCEKEGTLAAEDPGSVFVSYPRSIREVVESKVVKVIQASGTEFFFDERDLPQTGDLEAPLPWRLQLALARCGAILIVWSSDASRSYWMALEITTALAMVKNVFVVILDGTTTRLPPFLYPGLGRGLIRASALADFAEAVQCGKLLERRVDSREVVTANRTASAKTVTIGSTSLRFVSLSGGVLRDLCVAAYPITQKQWIAVLGENPSRYQGDDTRPVESVSWHDANRFVDKLNVMTGLKCRLLKDVEWEFACRAGGTGNWCWGDDEDRVIQNAWCSENTGIGTEPGTEVGVGLEDGIPSKTFELETSPHATDSVFSKGPNEWGLWHMHGNVSEWCANPSPSGKRVVRGGSFRDPPLRLRASHREFVAPHERHDHIGFRICADAVHQS